MTDERADWTWATSTPVQVVRRVIARLIGRPAREDVLPMLTAPRAEPMGSAETGGAGRADERPLELSLPSTRQWYLDFGAARRAFNGDWPSFAPRARSLAEAVIGRVLGNQGAIVIDGDRGLTFAILDYGLSDAEAARTAGRVIAEAGDALIAAVAETRRATEPAPRAAAPTRASASPSPPPPPASIERTSFLAFVGAESGADHSGRDSRPPPLAVEPPRFAPPPATAAVTPERPPLFGPAGLALRASAPPPTMPIQPPPAPPTLDAETPDVQTPDAQTPDAQTPDAPPPAPPNLPPPPSTVADELEATAPTAASATSGFAGRLLGCLDQRSDLISTYLAWPDTGWPEPPTDGGLDPTDLDLADWAAGLALEALSADAPFVLAVPISAARVIDPHARAAFADHWLARPEALRKITRFVLRNPPADVTPGRFREFASVLREWGRAPALLAPPSMGVLRMIAGQGFYAVAVDHARWTNRLGVEGLSQRLGPFITAAHERKVRVMLIDAEASAATEMGLVARTDYVVVNRVADGASVPRRLIKIDRARLLAQVRGEITGD